MIPRRDTSFWTTSENVVNRLNIRQPIGAADLSQLPRQLPATGLGEEQTLDLMASLVQSGAVDLGSETAFAHMDPPTPWVTWVIAYWNAALNQNLLHEQTSPSARPIEDRVVQWLCPYFGADGGQVVPGSTIANLTALWAARELRGITEVVASADAHLSVAKSANILGLKYRAVPVDQDRRINEILLGDLSSAALVLTAGTTSAGVIDPLFAGQNARWRHVDAAWAGPFRLTDTYGHLLDGIDLADSVSISAHKLLFQPKESAVVLFSSFRDVSESSIIRRTLSCKVQRRAVRVSRSHSHPPACHAACLGQGRSGESA